MKLSDNTRRVLGHLVTMPEARTSDFNGMDRRAIHKLETLGLVVLGHPEPYLRAVRNHQGDVVASVPATRQRVTVTNEGRAVAAEGNAQQGGAKAAGGVP